MTVKFLSLAAASLFGAASLAQATVVINLGSANLSDQAGTLLQAGTLIQLVNLGANGVFDPISVADGSTAGLNRWVSGDDTVLDIPFQAIVGGNPVAGDFSSTSRFDLQFNTGGASDSTAGFLNRTFQFDFANLPSGIKLGIRWFPGLQASNFDLTTLAAGQAYGQFTRQSPSSIVNNGQYWVSQGDGANVTFDPLVTQSFTNGAGEANILGQATLTVVPEPAAIGLSLIGAAGLATLRRRRG